MSDVNLKKFLAYEHEYHGLEAVMRLQSVKRWHMIETIRTQTLAEHSANVAMLAALIAHTAPIEYFSSPGDISIMALVHDMPEAFTGDIPSHSKKHVSGVDSLEKSVMPKQLARIAPTPSSNDAVLLKLCDLADGIRFIRIQGLDGTAVHAQEGLESQLTAKRMEMDTLGWPEHIRSHVMRHVLFYAYEAH